jgi:hypothetical protein
MNGLIDTGHRSSLTDYMAAKRPPDRGRAVNRRPGFDLDCRCTKSDWLSAIRSWRLRFGKLDPYSFCGGLILAGFRIPSEGSLEGLPVV